MHVTAPVRTSLNALHIAGKSRYDMTKIGFKFTVSNHVVSGESDAEMFILWKFICISKSVTA
jgi:hypothetical protein